jgi:NAD(P)-dependent dehydrogenase (short-subunit alcohol dehydrogenase family)
MKNSHESRISIVTGAGRGIGRELAVRLAERGSQLVLIDLEKPSETAAAVGGDPLLLTGDVGSFEAWVGFAKAVENRFGRADIVVNNAGIYPFAPIDDLTEATWEKTLRVPADIVGPILFLTSEDAAFVTGQALVVDGGLYKIS